MEVGSSLRLHVEQVRSPDETSKWSPCSPGPGPWGHLHFCCCPHAGPVQSHDGEDPRGSRHNHIAPGLGTQRQAELALDTKGSSFSGLHPMPTDSQLLILFAGCEALSADHHQAPDVGGVLGAQREKRVYFPLDMRPPPQAC